MARTQLRAVKSNEPSKRLTVTEAAARGNRRDLLVALRARIATSVQNAETPARDLASLSRRLLEIAKEIEAIDAEVEGDDIGKAAATPDEDWPTT